MKREIMLFVLMAISGTVVAQISGGLKAGLNVGDAKVTFDGYSPDLKSKIGFHAGMYLNYAVSDNLSLQPEIMFSAVGAKYKETDEDYSYTEDYSFNYISVPLLLVYSINENVNIHAGPQLSFLTSAELKLTEYDFGDTYSETIDLKEVGLAKGTDFGLSFGLGSRFGKITAAVRYTIGLSNIADIPSAEVKTSVIQFSIGANLFGDN